MFSFIFAPFLLCPKQKATDLNRHQPLWVFIMAFCPATFFFILVCSDVYNPPHLFPHRNLPSSDSCGQQEVNYCCWRYHFSFNLSNNTVSVKLGIWWAALLIKCPWRETVGVLLPHFLCLLVTQLLDISHTTSHTTGSGQWTVHTSDSWHLQWSGKSPLYLPVAGGSRLKGQRNLKPTNRTLSPWMTVGQRTHSHESPHWTIWSEK